MLAAKVRIILEADGVVVAESDDAVLWRELFAKLGRTKRELDDQRIRRWRGAVLTNEDRLRIETVLGAVADARGVPIPLILGRRRTPTIVSARRLAIYLIRSVVGLSFPTIASVFGCHHSSVMTSWEWMEQRLDNPKYRAEADHLTEIVKAAAIG